MLSALTGFPLFQIEEERQKREGKRKRLRRGKICKMKALAKERGKSMLLFTGKKKIQPTGLLTATRGNV